MNHTSNINMLGIDPGTNTGIAVYELTNELEIIKINTFTFDLNKYIDLDLPNIEKEADRLIALESLLNNILKEYNPSIVALENAFFNKKFPLSGLKLSSFIGVITMTIRKHNNNIKIYKLQPKYIKKCISTGTALKDDMTEAVRENELIKKFVNVDNETEHSIDAVAIAYALLEITKNHPYVLIGT